MMRFGRKPQAVMPEIKHGLSELGYTAEEFRIETESLGDRVQFTASQRGLTLTGVVSHTPDGWVRVSVSPQTHVGVMQSRTTLIPPEPNGWYE